MEGWYHNKSFRMVVILSGSITQSRCWNMQAGKRSQKAGDLQDFSLPLVDEFSFRRIEHPEGFYWDTRRSLDQVEPLMWCVARPAMATSGVCVDEIRNLFLPHSPVLRRSSPTRGHAIVTRFVIAVYSTLWHISRNSLLEESVYPGI
jgi:hypothetical protein